MGGAGACAKATALSGTNPDYLQGPRGTSTFWAQLVEKHSGSSQECARERKPTTARRTQVSRPAYVTDNVAARLGCASIDSNVRP